ncbi:MAG TPA: amino acid adenylation domain-containing protein, partial [Longimicrobiaceae bacterium]|nr:amino acid adenylation domain-containing protein [Longimicrobiaceae bacterium]
MVCGGVVLPYGELDARANRLAHALRARGVGPETRVGVCLDRTPDLPVALLGVLRAGGAYVPLDPAHPADRLRYVLEDSGAALVLTSRGLAERLPASVARMELDAGRAALDARPPHPPAVPVAPENPAYVIYTSGSTGRPKGVLVEHRSLAAFLLAMRREPGMAAEDVLLAVTTPAFDIAGLELFLPLVVGARTVLADRATAADPRLLALALDLSGATVMQATPATWRMLLDGGWEGRPGLRALCGGEALLPGMAERLLERVAELWNVYGPTETTVWSTAHRVEGSGKTPPIGRPIAGTRVYVLDDGGAPVPPGLPGELCIGGAGVARGYLGRPELTAERFVPDPFSPEPGARMYRTGDRVRWLPRGELEYLSRIDQQVKVRGFRVEPREVEAALETYPGVREAVVVVRETRPGDPRLVGYVVPQGDAAVSVAELREWVRGRLPEYMVPSAVVVLDAFPLTPSGKLDRRSLPAPEPAPAREYVAPRTRVEEVLAEIWAETLGVERVGVHANFFELGGHSLLAAQLVARIRVLRVEVPVRQVFQSPTVAGLAESIVRNEAQPGATEMIAGVLLKLK